MQSFNCYICMTDTTADLAKQVCWEQRHQVCSTCFPDVNRKRCPMCRQKNPFHCPEFENDNCDLSDDNNDVSDSDGSSSSDDVNDSDYFPDSLDGSDISDLDE